LELDLLQLQFVLKWPYCLPSVAVQVTVFDPFTKLAGERVAVTVVQLSGAWAVGEN
jgi:hypothetical protein